MSNTIIQIKRSTTTATPANLQPGELAYTSNGEVLFIGSVVGTDVANVVAIAGKRTPGVLTANQALVANASSWIDAVQTSKLIIGTTTETINVTSISTDGSISGANNSGNVLLTANAVKDYVDNYAASSLDELTDVTISTVANNDILVYDAAVGQWENHTVSGTSDQVNVSFSGQNITVGLTANVTVSNHLTTNTLAVSDTTESSNTTTGSATIAGGLGVAKKLNVKELAVGNTSQYSGLTGNTLTTENVFATGTVNATVLSVGGWVIANNSGLFTSGVVNTNVLKVSNNTNVLLQANDTQISIANGITLVANGSTGTTGQVLASNGAGLYWTTITADIEEVVAGDGLAGGGTSGSVTLDVGAGDGIAVNATAVSVKANNGIVANSSGVFVNPGTGVTVNSSGVHVGQDISNTANVVFNTLTINGNTVLGNANSDNVSIVGGVNTNILPQSNVTYSLGTEDQSWANVHANTIHAGYGNFDHDVTISGNLFVTGALVTINVATLSVTDSLIQLASNNTVGDTLDIGFFGSYQVGGGDHEHTGLFRDATDGRYKLFEGLTVSPTTTVDTSNNTFAISTLQAYLLSGGLTTNSTAVTITANSTVNVAIVANTLSLTTALGVASGGTGKTSATNNAVLFGNTTGPLGEATGSNGQVLQITGNVPTFGGLDGGTF